MRNVIEKLLEEKANTEWSIASLERGITTARDYIQRCEAALSVNKEGMASIETALGKLDPAHTIRAAIAADRAKREELDKAARPDTDAGVIASERPATKAA